MKAQIKHTLCHSKYNPVQKGRMNYAPEESLAGFTVLAMYYLIGQHPGISIRDLSLLWLPPVDFREQ